MAFVTSLRGWASARLLLPCLTLALAGCATPPSSCSATGDDVVCTAQGALRGSVEGDTLSFKGVPYARALRWQAPADTPGWDGVRDATRYGPVCPQLQGNNVVGDEDCLTLNIWRPRTAPQKPLPVMVFLTGGGNHAFSGQGAAVFGGVRYSGERLVPEGVVFVSFNYRLGALGFLAHPSLAVDSVSGNYGTQDQLAMLRWLQRHIAAFGGDPQRIMLFGTSAGGGNICTLMAAPAARGLFHRAAMQASVPTGCELPTLAQAEQGTGAQVAAKLGCTGGDAAACLRSKPMADVVRAVPGTFGLLPRLYGPVVDGRLVPEQPLATIRRGAHASMPVIVGNSTQETMLFVNSVGPVTDATSYEGAIARVFGAAQVARIAQAYPLSAHASPRDALVKLSTDALFTCQSRRVTRALAAHQAHAVYRYLFDHALENDPALKAQGAVHTVEHPFFFAWQGSYQPTAADLAVQRELVSRWVALARDGRLPGDRWPNAVPGDAYLRIAPQTLAAQGDAGAQCDFWDTVPLPSPHL